MEYRHWALAMLCSAAVPACAIAQPSSGDPAPGNDSSAPAVTGEVVVTAQRRSEQLQDVPVAVTAIDRKTVETLGIRGLTDIQILTPNASFSGGYSYAMLYIRGIGASFVTPGLESPVAIYRDGVYIQRSQGVAELMDQFDPGSIQVLRGPQGTLYGRNATGGALLINSADPTDRFEAQVSGEYGRLDHRQLDATINIPLSADLRLRLSGRYREDGGYVTSRSDGSKHGDRRVAAVRAKLNWTPTSNTDLLLTLEYQRTKRDVDIQQLGDIGASCLLCSVAGITTKPGFYEQDTDQLRPAEGKFFSTNLRANVDFGAHTLTSVTGYRRENDYSNSDQDFTPLNAFRYIAPKQGGDTFTEDVQLTSKFDGKFNYLVGASYLRDRGFYHVQLTGFLFPNVGGVVPGANSTARTESISGFVEGYYYITPQLKATLGGRYTEDKRTLLGSVNAGLGGPFFLEQDFKYSAFTPRFVLVWDNGPTNVYYSYSRGFKAGGFFTPALAPVTGVSPEKAESHEVGLKTRAFDNRLRTNLAAFYYKNRNLQTTILDTSAGGSRAVNAGAARGYGAELEVQYAAAEGLDLGATVSYLDAEYTSFPNALVSCLDTGPLQSAALTPLFACGQDLKGAAPPHAPRWTAAVYGNYDFHLGQWSGNFGLVARYQSKFGFSPGFGGVPGRAVSLAGTGHASGRAIGYDVQDGYTIVNASAYISPPGERVRLGVYVDNLLDKKYADYRAASQPFGLFYVAGKPRTYGVRASYRY